MREPVEDEEGEVDGVECLELGVRGGHAVLVEVDVGHPVRGDRPQLAHQPLEHHVEGVVEDDADAERRGVAVSHRQPQGEVHARVEEGQEGEGGHDLAQGISRRVLHPRQLEGLPSWGLRVIHRRQREEG